MRTLGKVMFAVAMGAGVLAVGAGRASAAIVCNGAGVCWHATETYQYKPEYGVVVHPDNWRWAANEHYRWHEHDGRGYWDGDHWRTF
jgi:hypothetical protein